MFEPHDKFFNKIQLNGTIYESEGVVVSEVMETSLRRRFALIERSTTDENEYSQLQREIIAFDKINSPYVLKIHRYTYDLLLSEETFEVQAFKKKNPSADKKIYKVIMLVDYFTTNLQLWIEKRKATIEKHNSQLSNTVYSKTNTRKGLPQYEFCSIFYQVAEGIAQVYLQENLRCSQTSLKEYTCDVDVTTQNFVVNETAGLDGKVKFVPIKFLAFYTPEKKYKRMESLFANQERHTLKRRQTIEMHNMWLKGGQMNRPSSTFSNFSGISSSSFSQTSFQTSEKLKFGCNLAIEDLQSKYLRLILDIALQLGHLLCPSPQPLTQPGQPLSSYTNSLLIEVCGNYKNLSSILQSLANKSKLTLASLCTNLRLVNEQEFQEQSPITSIDYGNAKKPKLNKQTSILTASTASFTDISNYSQNSFKLIGSTSPSDQRRSSLCKYFPRKTQSMIKNPSLTSKNNSSLKIPNTATEILDIERVSEKKPLRFKGLVFMKPHSNEINILHVGQKLNAYLETISVISPENFTAPDLSQVTLFPGPGEFKLLIVGGRDSKSCYEYHNIYEGTLLQKKNMLANFERHSFGFCSIEKDSKLLVASGIKDGMISSQAEMFDLVQNEWYKISNVNYPTANSTLCAFNKHFVYKFGGIDHNGKICCQIERYDVHLDIWNPIQYDLDSCLQQTRVPFASNMLAIQINHNQMILLGGEHCNSSSFFQKKNEISENQLQQRKIVFIHVDKLDHHELFQIQQLGQIPDCSAGPILPQQIAISDQEVVFFQKQTYRQNTGRLLWFSAEQGIRDLRRNDIRY